MTAAVEYGTPMSGTSPSADVKAPGTAVRLVLAAIVLFSIVSCTYRTIAVPWFTMTEEFPYAQEVLRFLSGDFRQQFFDIPGTPFMAVVTVAYLPILLAISLVSGHAKPIANLAFDHLDLLYGIMRGVSLLAFAAATWNVFLIARRFARDSAALVAGAAFAIHPIIGLTLYHTRIEPFALWLISTSILAWLRGIESGRWAWYAGAAVISGLAMAARFGFALATLPVFLFYALLRPARIAGAGKVVDRVLAAALLALALVGGALAAARLSGWTGRNSFTDLLFLSVPRGEYPRALHAIARLWVAAGTLSAGTLLLALVASGRRFLRRYVDSSLVTLAALFPVGLLIGVPTLFAGSNFFLGSIENFIVRNGLVQPNVGRGVWGVFVFYLVGQDGLPGLYDLKPFIARGYYAAREAGVLFNIPLLILFACGVFRRGENRWLHRSAIVGCGVAIVAQFGKLQSTRHIAGWLPWFCIILAAGADWIVQRGVPRRALIVAGIAILVAILSQRSILMAYHIDQLVEKAVLQSELDQWLRRNIGADEQVFHTCCEPITSGVTLSWMRANGVAVPDEYLANGSTIWFGELSTLRAAGDGYVITSRLSYPGQYVDYYRQMNPAEMVDPYHDPRFARRMVIPGRNTYDIFHFEMNDNPRLSSGGIAIHEATYGQNCAGAAVPRGWTNTVRRGNATRAMVRACNRRETCDFTVTAQVLGDPAAFCAKDFAVEWSCADGRSQRTALPAEALGRTISLRCAAE